jgi:hypothetical protein
LAKLIAKVDCRILINALNQDVRFDIALSDESVHSLGDDRTPPPEE